MAGIKYQLVKKYRNKFIYTIIKWKSKYYTPTASGNKVALVVEDISKYDDASKEYGWNEEKLLSEGQEPIDEFFRIFIAHYQMGRIEPGVFEEILDGLQVGQDINSLKKAYKKTKDDNYLMKRDAYRLEQKLYENIIEKRRKERRTERRIEEDKEKEEKKRRRELQKECEPFKRLLEKNYLKLKEQMEALDEKERRRIILECEKRKPYRLGGNLTEFCLLFVHEPYLGRNQGSPDCVFDYITVNVSCVELVTEPLFVPLVQLNKDRISRDVIETIENSEEFNKYGIPINFLKLERVSLNKESRELLYLFRVKEIPEKHEEEIYSIG